MSKLIQIIKEEISAISKDKKEEIFDYRNIVENAWRIILQEAMDFQKIHFDLENNDSTGQKKRFFSKKNLRKGQPIKYEINAELFEAGGDWENPVMYFRLEFTHDYGIIKSDEWKKSHKPEYVWDTERDNKYGTLYHNFCIIPPVEAGNKLKKGSDDDKLYAYDSNENGMRITDADKRNAWEWLSKLLEKVINERHEMLDDSNESEPKATKPDEINESKKVSDYRETKSSILKSTSIPKEMKDEILKYVTSGSRYEEGGHVYGLMIPNEVRNKSKKSSGVSMGADKNGFFVYTHRARSKSHSIPDKITIKEIDFIESTG